MWLINLIENMLSVTRLEEGRMNLNISVELVDDVIQEALRHVDRKKMNTRSRLSMRTNCFWPEWIPG